jgi:phage replication initiation protein
MDSPFTLTIDWLAFTVLAATAEETMRILGGDWSKAKAGFRGYPLSWIRADGVRGVGKLGTRAPRRPNEIHVDLSGGIVSTLTLEQIRHLLRWIEEQQGHLTRIDCALDDRTVTVTMDTIRRAVVVGQCVTRAKTMRRFSSSPTHGPNVVTGETIYFGSPQSETLLRIYDKRLELKTKEQEHWQDYGVRWELEFKKERAQLCGRALAYFDEALWREFVISLLRAYVDFRQTDRDADDEDRYRAPLVEWYSRLTEGFQKGRLVAEKREQTLRQVKSWVSGSLTPMLAVVCAIPGGEEWLQREIVEGKLRWKERHRNLLKHKPKQSSLPPAGGHAGSLL